MEPGRISQTALKVAATMITLNQKRGWAERLPEGMAELTERLILAARVPPYTRTTLRMGKRRWAASINRSVNSAIPSVKPNIPAMAVLSTGTLTITEYPTSAMYSEIEIERQPSNIMAVRPVVVESLAINHI